jgi:glucose/arabinose dehydrogenase
MRALLHAALIVWMATAPALAAPFISDQPGEMRGVRLTQVVGGLERPWGMAFLPDGSILVTERPGRLRVIRDGALVREAVSGVPPVHVSGQGGLLDVALHPDFASNRMIYLTYAHGNSGANRTRLARATFDGSALRDVQVIFEVNREKPANAHFGSRLAFLPDGTLLMTVGDGGNPPNSLDGRFIREQAQNPASHLGKILRLNADGSAPRDNPFLNTPGYAPEIWSVGHRNSQGLVVDPTRNVIWANEHGSSGGDELNLLRGGQNHGWPVVTFSVEYQGGAQIGRGRSMPGLVDPALVWLRTAAPSGLAVVTSARYPGWRGDLISGSLRAQDIRRVRADAQGQVLSEEILRVGQRVRDVRQAPDGYLYVLTDAADGALLRLDPAR